MGSLDIGSRNRIKNLKETPGKGCQPQPAKVWTVKEEMFDTFLLLIATYPAINWLGFVPDLCQRLNRTGTVINPITNLKLKQLLQAQHRLVVLTLSIADQRYLKTYQPDPFHHRLCTSPWSIRYVPIEVANREISTNY